MLKYSALILGLFLALSSANTQNNKQVKLQQREVDLNKFQNTEVLHMAKEELQKHLPQIIDSYTTLVDVRTKDLTLIKVYEINSGSKSDEAIIKEDHSRMEKAITQGTCHTSQRFLKSGITLSYLYISAKSKVKLFEFNVSKKDCPLLER